MGQDVRYQDRSSAIRRRPEKGFYFTNVVRTIHTVSTNRQLVTQTAFNWKFGWKLACNPAPAGTGSAHFVTALRQVSKSVLSGDSAIRVTVSRDTPHIGRAHSAAETLCTNRLAAAATQPAIGYRSPSAHQRLTPAPASPANSYGDGRCRNPPPSPPSPSPPATGKPQSGGGGPKAAESRRA